MSAAPRRIYAPERLHKVIVAANFPPLAYWHSERRHNSLVVTMGKRDNFRMGSRVRGAPTLFHLGKSSDPRLEGWDDFT